ncbi:MAG TPA: HGGxSTG domain-containing protein [Bradyrhizobium sp.]|nr:HGGxSTG domain-containing protein [Bradyrhizobium sp.]
MHPTRDPTRLFAAPRCGARTRSGGSCRSPAIKGKARCRMHGGKGSGAPHGERNGRYTAGRFTKAAKAKRAETIRAVRFVRLCAAIVRSVYED